MAARNGVRRGPESAAAERHGAALSFPALRSLVLGRVAPRAGPGAGGCWCFRSRAG